MNIDVSNIRNDRSLSCLLYLYLWPLWIFENANAGSFLERAAAYRRNRCKRVYLPGYTAKWTVIFGMLLVTLSALEGMGNLFASWKFPFTLLACGTGILAILAFVVVMMTIAIYLLLTHWEY